MATSPKKIRRVLTDSLAQRSPVLVIRADRDSYRDEGYVIGLTSEWVVLHSLDAAHLDAVVLLRLDLVTSAEPLHAAEFVQRAQQSLGTLPASFDCEPTDTTVGLLRRVDAAAGLICIRLELWDDFSLYIGKVRRIGRKRLDLQAISAQGTWDDHSNRWTIDDITRIEFGGRYITSLERWGDPVPAAPKRRVRQKTSS